MSQQCILCIFSDDFVEKKCVVDGWDSSFTTDSSLLQHNNSMSTAELLAGFFQFYAQFDFRANVVCPRLGNAVDVASFIDRQQSDPKFIGHFKVCMLGQNLQLLSETVYLVFDVSVVIC